MTTSRSLYRNMPIHDLTQRMYTLWVRWRFEDDLSNNEWLELERCFLEMSRRRQNNQMSFCTCAECFTLDTPDDAL